MHDKSACSSRLGVKYSIPRPSLPPVFDWLLQYAKTEGDGLGFLTV